MPKKSGIVVALLAVLATVQVGAIMVTVHHSPATAPALPRLPDLAMGEHIRTIPGRDSLGRPFAVRFPTGGKTWTVLLAFSPTCAWCDSVAPRWKQWTAAAPDRVRLTGVVGADHAAGLAYVHAHGWKLDALLQVDSALTGNLGRQLTRKTPWFFLLDSAGVLRYSGHGNEIGVVDSIVAAAVAR